MIELYFDSSIGLHQKGGTAQTLHISWTKVIINPLTPKISLVILPTICHKTLMILIWRIWYWINL